MRFDECDATHQQRTSTVLFIEAFRAGLAACGWASDAFMPLAALRLQTGKAGAAGLRSLLTPPLWGPVSQSRLCLPEPASPPCGLFWVMQAAPSGEQDSLLL